MEINWLIIILAFAAILAVITFLVRQNQKDEKTLMRKSMEENEMSDGEESDSKTED